MTRHLGLLKKNIFGCSFLYNREVLRTSLLYKNAPRECARARNGNLSTMWTRARRENVPPAHSFLWDMKAGDMDDTPMVLKKTWKDWSIFT